MASESSWSEISPSPPPNFGGIDPDPFTVFLKACSQATLILLRWLKFQLAPAVRWVSITPGARMFKKVCEAGTGCWICSLRRAV